MALELAGSRIRVNTVAPGPTAAALVEAMHTGEERQRIEQALPLGRYGLPAEIARAAAFLVDDASAGFVTGATLCVDGGFSAASPFG